MPTKCVYVPRARDLKLEVVIDRAVVSNHVAFKSETSAQYELNAGRVACKRTAADDDGVRVDVGGSGGNSVDCRRQGGACGEHTRPERSSS
jgi:hypothetical protein